LLPDGDMIAPHRPTDLIQPAIAPRTPDAQRSSPAA
jgi:hypothetical protein